MICKHTVSSLAKTRSLYAFLFSCLIILSYLVFSCALSNSFFTATLRILSLPSRPSLSKKLLDHICHLSFSTLKGIILMLFSPMLLELPWWWYLIYPQRELQSMLEVSVNLYSAKSFYTVGVSFVIIMIMISLVDFLKPFAVCITIKTITNFPIWNSFPLLFIIILFSFLFLFHNASVPHLISPLRDASASL